MLATADKLISSCFYNRIAILSAIVHGIAFRYYDVGQRFAIPKSFLSYTRDTIAYNNRF